jgi:hypothetical protein
LLTGHLGQVDAHAQAQEVVELGHPLGVAACQVVVDRDQVHALAAQGIEVDGQGGRERFAFARAHFGDLAVVQRDAAQHLHVKVAHLEDALGAFTHHGEGFGQQVVQRFALGQAGAEFVGLATQLLVAQGLQRGLQCVDLGHRATVLLEQSFVTATENRGENLGQHGAINPI